MPRLIDADELYVDARCGENEEPYISLYQINNAPTVDAEPTEEQVKEYCHKRCLVIVTSELFNEMKARWSAEPVRHGQWVHNKWSNMRHDYSCSLCGCRIEGVDPFSLSATAYNYCPECGAKMDEVEDG